MRRRIRVESIWFCLWRSEGAYMHALESNSKRLRRCTALGILLRTQMCFMAKDVRERASIWSAILHASWILSADSC